MESAGPSYHNALFETKQKNRNSGKLLAMKKHEIDCPPWAVWYIYHSHRDRSTFFFPHPKESKLLAVHGLARWMDRTMEMDPSASSRELENILEREQPGHTSLVHPPPPLMWTTMQACRHMK